MILYAEARQIIDNEYKNYKILNEDAKKKLLDYALSSDNSAESEQYVRELVNQVDPEFSSDRINPIDLSYPFKMNNKAEETCLSALKKACDCFKEEQRKEQEELEEEQRKEQKAREEYWRKQKEQEKKKEEIENKKETTKIVIIAVAVYVVLLLMFISSRQ